MTDEEGVERSFVGLRAGPEGDQPGGDRAMEPDRREPLLRIGRDADLQDADLRLDDVDVALRSDQTASRISADEAPGSANRKNSGQRRRRLMPHAFSIRTARFGEHRPTCFALLMAA